MQFTHSRAIRNVETPGSEGSIQCGRQTLPFPSGSQKNDVCWRVPADRARHAEVFSEGKMGRKQKINKLNQELAWEQLSAW